MNPTKTRVKVITGLKDGFKSLTKHHEIGAQHIGVQDKYGLVGSQYDESEWSNMSSCRIFFSEIL